MKNQIAAKKVGQSVKLTISRNGKTSEVSVTLAKTPNAIEQQRIMQQKMQQQQQLEQEQFGR